MKWNFTYCADFLNKDFEQKPTLCISVCKNVATISENWSFRNNGFSSGRRSCINPFSLGLTYFLYPTISTSPRTIITPIITTFPINRFHFQSVVQINSFFTDNLHRPHSITSILEPKSFMHWLLKLNDLKTTCQPALKDLMRKIDVFSPGGRHVGVVRYRVAIKSPKPIGYLFSYDPIIIFLQ